MEEINRLEKELNLKQLQIKSLMNITQAINDNVPAEGLFNMYKVFLNWEMGVKKMGLFIKKDDDTWECVTEINTPSLLVDKTVLNSILAFKRLHKVTQRDEIGLQDFDIIIPVFHKDEPIAYSLIGECGEEDEDMYNKIQFITTITNVIAVAIENKRLFKKQIQQEKLKREIELASEVQNMLIPSDLPKNEVYELSSIYKPHYNIGGDYFDYIKISEEKFIFCIADISGKGVAAALLMSNFQANLQNLVYSSENLRGLVKRLNKMVYKVTKSDKFLTFFIALVDLSKNTVTYVNAGHFPPMMYTDKECKLLDKGCTIIGVFEELPEIEEETIDIIGETTILTFTDGLTDMKNIKGEYFDEFKLKSFIERYHHLNAINFNNKLVFEMEEFNEGIDFPDDIAVLTCKIFNAK